MKMLCKVSFQADPLCLSFFYLSLRERPHADPFYPFTYLFPLIYPNTNLFNMFEWIGNMCTSSWVAAWHPPNSLRSHFPTRHSDFRDSMPDDFQAVVDAYAPYVAKEGRWTLGLCDMW